MKFSFVLSLVHKEQIEYKCSYLKQVEWNSIQPSLVAQIKIEFYDRIRIFPRLTSIWIKLYNDYFMNFCGVAHEEIGLPGALTKSVNRLKSLA